jgi:Zn-dependent protease/CBS domain-containing protein
MKASFRLFRIAGIDIGIHYSWIFIFILIAWSLAQGFFPQKYPGWSVSMYWIIAIASALLLFISVLVHELAHSLVARSRGLPVNSITLFIFGGVSNLQEEPSEASVEFSMAIVGPLTSLILAGIFWGLLFLLPSRTTPLGAMFYYLALINALLAAFNILPGFPLDGGRVLRSIIWGATKNLSKATNVAATVGYIFGWALVAYGLYSLLTGNFLGGLWIAFIGWFLSSAAESSRKQFNLSEHLTGIKVKDVMKVNPETVDRDTSVDSVVRNIFYQDKGRAALVMKDNQLLGIVTIADVKKLPHDKWTETRVENIMTSTPLYTVSEEDDLNSAMQLIARHSINQIIVLRTGKPAGLLSRADIIHFLQVSQELGVDKGRKQTSI